MQDAKGNQDAGDRGNLVLLTWSGRMNPTNVLQSQIFQKWAPGQEQDNTDRARDLVGTSRAA